MKEGQVLQDTGVTSPFRQKDKRSNKILEVLFEPYEKKPEKSV